MMKSCHTQYSRFVRLVGFGRGWRERPTQRHQRVLENGVTLGEPQSSERKDRLMFV
jgi:hypothetical protein